MSAYALRGAIDVHQTAPTRRDNTHVSLSFNLTNRGAGHHIPTGKFGHRELRVVTELLDARQQVIADHAVSIMPGQDNCLAPGKAVSFSPTIAVPPDATPAAVRLRVERVNRDRSCARDCCARRGP